MALQIVVNKRAEINIDKTLSYLNSEWSEKIAGEFIENLFNIIELLSLFPELGTIVDDEKDIRGFLLVKQIKIYYRVKGNRLIILNLIDTRKKQK